MNCLIQTPISNFVGMYFWNHSQTRFSELRVNEIRIIQEVGVQVF